MRQNQETTTKVIKKKTPYNNEALKCLQEIK